MDGMETEREREKKERGRSDGFFFEKDYRDLFVWMLDAVMDLGGGGSGV